MKLHGKVFSVSDKEQYVDDKYRVDIKINVDAGCWTTIQVPVDFCPALGEPVEIEINIGGR